MTTFLSKIIDALYPAKRPATMFMENEMARITKLPDGKYAIINEGETIATYARKRDASRGASRRGIAVA